MKPAIELRPKIENPAENRWFLIPPRGVEHHSDSSGNSKKSQGGGAKSGARRAPALSPNNRAGKRAGTTWDKLPPELRKLIATLLKPYRET
jgi:hypothetical protein